MAELQAPDPFESAPQTASYPCGQLGSLRLRHYDGAQIPDAVLRWAVGLTECTCRAFYEDVWGWDGEKKRAELGHVRTALEQLLSE